MRATLIRWVVLAAACVCAVAAVQAQQGLYQQPPPQAGPTTAMIAGRVVDAASGDGISSATVMLLGGPPVGRGASNRSVLTDSRGRFVFPAIGAGKYQLRVDRVGFWSVPITTSRSIDLAVGEKVTDLTMPIHRYGSISGTVTDENGDPVSNMTVAGFRRQVVNGQVAEIGIGSAFTDDRGTYRMSGLKAGEYFVCACSRAPVPFDGVLLNTLASQPAQLIAAASRALKVGSDAATVERMLTYAPAFHPSSSTFARAAKVALADGDDRTGIDIQTPIVYAARVSGVVIGATATFNAGMLRLRPAGSPASSSAALLPMLVQPDGRFDFAAVPAGDYSLEVTAPAVARGAPAPPSGAALAFVGGRGAVGGILGQGPAPNEPLVWARVPVTVTDRDVVGMSVTVRPAYNVSGIVEWPAAAPTGRPAAAPRSVQLIRAMQESLVPGMAGEIKPDGSFTLANGLPGRYALSVNSAYQVVKAMVGDLDITDMPFVLDDRDVAEIKITLATPNRPTLQGTVAGDAKSGLTIVVFPTAKKLWAEPFTASRWFGTAAVSRTGAFTFASLLPVGEYFIAAVPDDQGVEWQMPSRLEALAARAQKITIGQDEVKTIEVRR